MDEVHYLADRFRGAVWEEVIIGLADSIQVVALSATVSNAEEFGDWLSHVRGEMAVVVSERRPVPLFQHVLVGHRLYDLFADVAPTAREDPGGRSDVNAALIKVAREESRFVRDDSRRPRGRGGRGRRTVSYGSGAYGGAAHRSRYEGARGPRSLSAPSRAEIVELLDSEALLPAIVFIFSRLGCDGAVRQLLSSGIELTDPDEQREISTLLVRHVSGLGDADLRALDYDRFSEALIRGVSAHHAGMLPAFKECVEEAFVRGLVKVVFATETLALGINMPARSVVLEKLVKYNGETHADITPGEYTQLTGRAGPPGHRRGRPRCRALAARARPARGSWSCLAPHVPPSRRHSRRPTTWRSTSSPVSAENGPACCWSNHLHSSSPTVRSLALLARRPRTPRRSRMHGMRRPVTVAISWHTRVCGPASPSWRQRRPGNGARIGGPSRCRLC